jgi:putative ABC transport system substrate-binding protein
LTAFRAGLNEMGYVEGRNVAITLRWAEQYDQLPELAAELVRFPVAVIFANNLNATLATKAATATIPVVFWIGGDPIRDGVVNSLTRPSGNLTGVTNFAGELLPKRLELLRELLPAADLIAVLVNPRNPNFETRSSDVQNAARDIGQRVLILDSGSESDIDAAFVTVVQQRAAALLVSDDPFLTSRREQIVALAARHAIPASYNSNLSVRAGGLMSYSASNAEQYRQVGRYVGRILKGDKPADLPVVQPVKFEFAINLKTAKALGIEFPPSFYLRADEVVE